MTKYQRGSDLGKDYKEISPKKNSNQCKVRDCQETKKEYENYCLNHNWECGAKSCSNRIRYETFGSSYCSRHKYSCPKEFCEKRVNSSYKYCNEHEQKYFCQGCQVRIGRGESYCSQHQNWKYCPVKNKVCRVSKEMIFIKDWTDGSRGFSLFPNYDKEENCQHKVFNGQEYCWQHQNECLNSSCQRRLDGKNQYCYDHAPTCPVLNPSGCYCTYKVTSGEVYCSGHKQVCNACSTRTDKDYCWDHEKACSDCSTRIAYNKYVCGNCENKSNEQERLKYLVKQWTSIPNPQEVVRFATWWNNNIATVVNYYDSYYRVFLLVYEPVYSTNCPATFPKDSSSGFWGEHSRGKHNYLSDAKNEASWLRNELTNYGKYYDNPILLIHPYSDCSKSFDAFVDKPYVIKKEIGSGSSQWYAIIVVCGTWTPSNLDEHFRPLDIVKIEKRDIVLGKAYFHVGIYLGKNSICHISDPNGLISEENMKVRITSWETFLKGWLGTNVGGRTGEMYRYRSIVPFKHYKKSIEQAVKAYWTDYGEGKYDLFNDNCEHFANAIVYGIYYSEQIGDTGWGKTIAAKIWDNVWTKQHNFFWKVFQPNHWSTLWREVPIINLINGRTFKTNNNKGSTINLKNEINSWNTNSRFSNLTFSELRDRREEYERQYLQEVPPKDNNCRIM